MQVTNVSVSFLREKQPAKFEKSIPAVEFTAILGEGENPEKAARELMTIATKVVYNGLGYDVPPRVATALASGLVPAELSVDTETTDIPEAASENPEEASDKPKTRGRPRGSKNTAPKKETAAVKRKREEAEAAKEADDDIPGDEEPKSSISTGDARVGPDDDPADHDIPGDDDTSENDEAEFTPKDLHTLIMSHVNATPRTLSVANAKQVLANFKVARAQDLSNEQAVKGKALVEKMVAAAGKG